MRRPPPHERAGTSRSKNASRRFLGRPSPGKPVTDERSESSFSSNRYPKPHRRQGRVKRYDWTFSSRPSISVKASAPDIPNTLSGRHVTRCRTTDGACQHHGAVVLSRLVVIVHVTTYAAYDGARRCPLDCKSGIASQSAKSETHYRPPVAPLRRPFLFSFLVCSSCANPRAATRTTTTTTNIVRASRVIIFSSEAKCQQPRELYTRTDCCICADQARKLTIDCAGTGPAIYA